MNQKKYKKRITGKQFGIPYLLDAGRYQEAASLNEACLSDKSFF